MSSTRRRTNSKTNGCPYHQDYPKYKPLAQRGSSRWFSVPTIARYASRKGALATLSGCVLVYILTWITPWFTFGTTDYRTQMTHNEPFPNAGTLSVRGKHALASLSAGGLPVSCPSQVTYVLPLIKQEIVRIAPLIARLQDTKCPVHLLVGWEQVKEIEDLLEVILPTTQRVFVFGLGLENDGAALTTLHHVNFVQTPWVWIMGPMDGEVDITLEPFDWAQKIPGVEFLFGIRGARLHKSELSCVPQTSQFEPVAFLTPPFMAPTTLLLQAEVGIISKPPADIWASLGERVARITAFGMGGALFPITSAASKSCQTTHTWGAQGHERVSQTTIDSLGTLLRSSNPDVLRFAFALPDIKSLHLLAPTACRMLQRGHDVYISVRTNSKDKASKLYDWAYADLGCHLHYRLDASSGSPDAGSFQLAHGINTWCLSTLPGTKILIITELDHDFGRDQVPLVERLCPEATAVMSLPYDDLQDSEWLSALTLQEWQAWNTPRIELAVITHDRPWSLTRLLNSIKRAHYFGDTVNIVINLEQTADLETRHIAETFSMNLNGGHVTVRHRIVYAGLMAAVVESWHPRGNHSYGVILEDDVELSPMFYAWVKFCILRYRYDARNNQSSQLYGVSLYQPKVTELRMEGRRPFDPKDIFAKLQLEHAHTPYLSQVPCSWGAVYFPEHWREFQRYLALRLSEHSMPVSDLVVPDLRSNKWSRSWKKFFNEMGTPGVPPCICRANI
ncbi:hypothetical protein FRC08_001800 [Ceratobasidium sp. 394]|nr:hypothetical protein FRC08_001800 [Ceratobasidium sp. 394]